MINNLTTGDGILIAFVHTKENLDVVECFGGIDEASKLVVVI